MQLLNYGFITVYPLLCFVFITGLQMTRVSGKHTCNRLLMFDLYWKSSSFFRTRVISLFSAYTFLKFMVMWMLVLLADFVLEFRLEYLWPCWLFFGSVYTTFHCHGLVRRPAVWFYILRTDPGWWLSRVDGWHFNNQELWIFLVSPNASYWNRCSLCLQVICVVFVCAAFTLDIFCLIFVPLHWLFFVASTYVLFNYIWHTGEHSYDDL